MSDWSDVKGRRSSGERRFGGDRDRDRSRGSRDYGRDYNRDRDFGRDRGYRVGYDRHERQAPVIPNEPPFKVFIGNLPRDRFGASELDNIFPESDGFKIIDRHLNRDRDSGDFKGSAFVEFETRSMMEKAIAKDGQLAFEQGAAPFRINPAHRRGDRGGRGGPQQREHRPAPHHSNPGRSYSDGHQRRDRDRDSYQRRDHRDRQDRFHDKERRQDAVKHQDIVSDATDRPKLQLKKRTKPIEEAKQVVRNPSIFGGAKPREENLSKKVDTGDEETAKE